MQLVRRCAMHILKCFQNIAEFLVCLDFSGYDPGTADSRASVRRGTGESMRKLTCALSLLSVLFLAACGGGASLGDGGGGGLGGGTTGGSTGGSGIPGNVDLLAGATQVVADGKSAVSLTATLNDTTGSAIAGKTLTFVTNAGTLSASSVTTDANGSAVVYLKSSNELGTATVTVHEPDSGISNNVSVSFVAASAGNITMTVAPAQVGPGGIASVNLQVVDANGNPVPGILVSLSTLTNNSGGAFENTLRTTDENGRASTTYQAGPVGGSPAVNDTLKASLAGGQSSIQNLAVATASQTQIGGVTLSAGSTSATVSPAPFNASTAVRTAITATVKDNSGNPMVGQTVTFSTSSGKMVGNSTPGATVSATTDATGRATVSQLSPTQIGSAMITATTGGYSADVALTFRAGPAANLTISASPVSVAPNGTSNVLAQVTDANGNTVEAGRSVKFSASTGTFNGGGSLLVAKTVDNGIATATYKAPATGGTATLTATATPENVSASTSVTIDMNAIPVGGITVSAGPTSIPADGTSTSTIRATVTGGGTSGGAPLAGVSVSFTTNAGTLSSSTAVTDIYGIATVTLTSDHTKTTAQIFAASGGVSGSTSVAFDAGDPKSVSIVLNPTSVAVNGTSTVSVTVRDASGNPLVEQTVNFTVPTNNSGGTLSAVSATTNSSGVATVVYTAGSAVTSSSQDSIQAQVGGLPPASATLTVSSSVRVTSISLIASSPQLLSNATAAPSGVTLTAIVKDQNNNVVPNTKVTFASRVDTGSCGTGGALQLVDGGNTNASGQATAILTTGGDTTNQVINVTATATGASSSTKIAETGTTIAINGPDSVGLGAKQSFTVSFKDAGSKPIASRVLVVTSANSNSISAHAGSNCSGGACTTDGSGQFTIDYTGVSGGKDTLTVTPQACGNDATSAQQSVQVAAQTLTIVAPADNAEIPFGTNFSAGAEIAAAGSGYVIGDALTLNGGTATTAAQLVVTAVSGTGAITGFTIRNAGDYTVLPVSPATSNGGSGTGATFTVWQNITVRLAGGAVNGQTITFNATRGTLSAPTAVTNASGIAAVRINQTSAAGSAGGAVVTATCTSCSPTISASTSLQFDATTPARVDLQASPSIVAVNGTSVITAVVRDANDNLVANQRVNFTLIDNSGGGLQQSTAVTNSGGKATITYNAGPTTGSKDGVQVTGTTAVGGVSGKTVLTVGGQALRMVLGTGNSITALNTTQYQLPYSVLVTDSAGNPPPSGSVVNLQINALSYSKGSEAWNGKQWVPNYSVTGCLNEDTIPPLNGILDSGEDFNHNGKLDPGNVTSVPVSVALDANGTGEFSITYPKDRAYWVVAGLDATITVNGDQGRTSVQFVLPGLSADFTQETVSPPGQTSPYGTAASCANAN